MFHFNALDKNSDYAFQCYCPLGASNYKHYPVYFPTRHNKESGFYNIQDGLDKIRSILDQNKRHTVDPLQDRAVIACFESNTFVGPEFDLVAGIYGKDKLRDAFKKWKETTP